MRSFRDPPPTAPEVRELSDAEVLAARRQLALVEHPPDSRFHMIREGISCDEPFLGCKVYRITYESNPGVFCVSVKAERLAFVPSAPLRPTKNWQLPRWIADAARARWPKVKEWELITWEMCLTQVTTPLQTHK